MTGDGEFERQPGLDRMLAFGDAVVAIAITLVALPLVERASAIGRDGTGKFLADNAFALISAGVSFAALYALWRAHHGLFMQARGYTTSIIWINGLWLACAAALPIATVLAISSGGQDRISSSLYVLTLTVAITSAETIGWQMNRHHLLIPHGDEAETMTFARLLLPTTFHRSFPRRPLPAPAVSLAACPAPGRKTHSRPTQ
jgi:uncharacterized membrane protein